MATIGGDLSIIATENFENINDALLFLYGLDKINDIFTTSEKEKLQEYRDQISDNKQVVFDGMYIAFQKNCFDDMYPSLEYFEHNYKIEEANILASRAELIDRIISIKISVKHYSDLKLCMYITLAIVALSNGIINSIAFPGLPSFNTKNNFHTPREWSDILSKIEYDQIS